MCLDSSSQQLFVLQSAFFIYRLALRTLSQQTRKCGLCAVDVSTVEEKLLRNEAGEKDFGKYVTVRANKFNYAKIGKQNIFDFLDK